MWEKKYVKELEDKRKAVLQSGGEEKVAKQHQRNKLTARERIDRLFDPGTFTEINSFVESRIDDFGLKNKKVLGDGVITGYGCIHGRIMCASSEDFTVIGGTLGEYHSLKICKIMDKALEMKVPYIAINDSGGARIEEGISSLNGYSGIFLRNTKASGIIPQISVIMGPCAGGACYSPAISDFIFMTKHRGRMFITGPKVVEQVIGEKISDFDLGGTEVHMKKSGVAHFSYESDESCLDAVRKLLEYLPQNNEQKPKNKVGWDVTKGGNLENIVSDNQRQVYDVVSFIKALVDKDSFFEVQSEFAKNIVIGFSRIEGKVIGIVANQPEIMGGALDYNASEKAARFIRTCDCFQIPLLTIVDTPGFFPGKAQEHGGIIRKGAKLLYAYSEATTPKVTLILRKAYGGAYIAMNSKGMGADIVYAWPIAQIAVMGAEGAVDILFKSELLETESLREQFIAEYKSRFMTPYIAAARGFVDEIILPEESRGKIVQAFRFLETKKQDRIWKKHGNIPL